MRNIPGHTSPPYSDEARDDALFHYTTANGLIGIFQNAQIWSTAYYCANDEEELVYGKGVLSPLFRKKAHELRTENDPRIETLLMRGVDVTNFADNFENIITSRALTSLCAYITCFCKPLGEEDFKHGLLSQWRGYGIDGGYAIQFSREKLLKAIENSNSNGNTNYDLQDVCYSEENELKDKLLSHKDAFINSFLGHLDENAKPLDVIFNRKELPNPLLNLFEGPLESFLDYLIQTKNKHFSEERECRLSHIQLAKTIDENLGVEFFNRNGLVVPYTKTPKESFNLLECIEWIVIGPGPRLEARMKSIIQLMKEVGLNISVRPSHIPFTRL